MLFLLIKINYFVFENLNLYSNLSPVGKSRIVWSADKRVEN